MQFVPTAIIRGFYTRCSAVEMIVDILGKCDIPYSLLSAGELCLIPVTEFALFVDTLNVKAYLTVRVDRN